MAGHNHYSDCICPWCVQYGRAGLSRERVRSFLSERDARRCLREFGANSYSSSCFVQPNAKCPVCGSTVFFYANSYGSRVYFDDLGPPWPKHPCTDHRLQNEHTVRNVCPAITPRKRGEKVELVEAASSLGIYRGISKHDPNSEWRHVVVDQIDRNGWEVNVWGRITDAIDDIPIQFEFTSSEEVVSIGSIVLIRNSEMSLIHPQRIEPRDYKIRNWMYLNKQMELTL